MAFNVDISLVRARLLKAEAARDTWQRTGLQEKYMEACSTVQALEIELDRLRKLGLRSLLR